jgi:hypothetical protein
MRSKRLALFSAALCVLLSCSSDYNPFENPANVTMWPDGPRMRFGNGDTLRIFSTDTLALFGAVPDLIDSVAVHISANRYGSDTTIVNPGKQTIHIPVCFVDTGAQKILVTTYRSNGDAITSLEWTLHAHSPLSQPPLSAAVGSPLTLQTAPVKDSVWYHWACGPLAGDTIHTLAYRSSFLASALGSFKGALWVSLDSAGNSLASPRTVFTLQISDNDAPDIMLPSAGDTLYSAEDNYLLDVNIRDAGGVDSVSIDGEQQQPRASGRYWKNFSGLSTLADSVRTITIRAIDRDGNVRERQLSLGYDATLLSSSHTRLEITSVRDTVTNQRRILLAGEARDMQRSTLGIRIESNRGDTTPIQWLRLSDHQASWVQQLDLEDGVNILRIYALDSLGNSVAMLQQTMLRVSSFTDTTAPLIFRIALNGRDVTSGGSYLLPDTLAQVNVWASDESGIGAVTVNELPAALDTVDFSWHADGLVLEAGENKLVQVAVNDGAGRVRRMHFSVRQNHAPRIEGWDPPLRIFAQKPLQQLFSITDDDGVSITPVDFPPGMTLTQLGGHNQYQLTYTAPLSAVGSRFSPRLQLSDGFESVEAAWSFGVLRDTSGIVKLSTVRDTLPLYLQATRDTFHLTLSPVAQRGQSPYKYNVVLLDRGQMLLSNSCSGTLKWAPTLADTGMQDILCILSDSFGDSDSLFHRIQVVRPNVDSVKIVTAIPPQLPRTAQGALDLSKTDQVQRLTITLDDSDHPLTEHHQISVTLGGSTTTIPANSTAFELELQPLSTVFDDTLVIIVTDNTGARDTATIPLHYADEQPDTANIWSWHRSDALTLYGGGTRPTMVSRWNSRISNGLSFEHFDTRGPAMIANSVRGYSMVDFAPATTPYYLIDFSPNSAAKLRSAHTAFFVVQLNQLAAGIAPPFRTVWSTSDYDSGLVAFGVDANGYLGVCTRKGSAAQPDTVVSSKLKVSENSWHVLSLRTAGITSQGLFMELWVDGRSDTLLFPGALQTYTYLMLGGANKHALYAPLQGKMLEVMGYDAMLAEAQRAQVQHYLAARYGIELFIRE